MTDMRTLSGGTCIPASEDGFVTFRLGEQLLGLPVIQIQEVLNEQPICPIPRSDAYVAGFLNRRGQIVTALELRTRVGLPGRAADEPAPMNVVVFEGDEFFSLLVDSVGDVVAVPPEEVEMVPGNLEAAWRELACGVVQLRDEVMIVLDLRQVVALRQVAVTLTPTPAQS